MPARKSKELLSYNIAQVVQSHHVEHKTLQETADRIGVSRKTVKRMKKTETYHELATAAAEELGEPIEKWMGTLIKIKNEGDNERNRLAATMKGLDIFGAEPPKKEEHAHTFQTMSDDELRKQIKASVVNESITETANATGLVETTAGKSGPAMAEGQQPPCPNALEKE